MMILKNYPEYQIFTVCMQICCLRKQLARFENEIERSDGFPDWEIVYLANVTTYVDAVEDIFEITNYARSTDIKWMLRQMSILISNRKFMLEEETRHHYHDRQTYYTHKSVISQWERLLTKRRRYMNKY
jgi:hypothetical protein